MEGGGWAALGVINGYQLYLFKDAIQGRMNHLKAPFKVGPARWLAPTLAVAFMVPLLLVNFKEYVTKDVPKQDPEKFQRLVEQESPSKWIALKNRLERVCFIEI